MQAFSLVIDHRERASGVPDALREAGVAFRYSSLPTGDYLLPEGVLFERKTAGDFARSVADGRLFRQASRLACGRWRPCFVLEGSAADWRAAGLSREALLGALTSLSLVFDLPVLRAMDHAETARLLRFAGEQLVRAVEGGSLPSRKAVAKRRMTRKVRVLQSIPGVGPERARRLLRHFGSIRSCLGASEAELAAVPGVGPGVARKILDIAEEPPGTYGSRSSGKTRCYGSSWTGTA